MYIMSYCCFLNLNQIKTKIGLYWAKCVDYKILGLSWSICLVISNNAVKHVWHSVPMITCFIIAQNNRIYIQNVYLLFAWVHKHPHTWAYNSVHVYAYYRVHTRTHAHMRIWPREYTRACAYDRVNTRTLFTLVSCTVASQHIRKK